MPDPSSAIQTRPKGRLRRAARAAATFVVGRWGWETAPRPVKHLSLIEEVDSCLVKLASTMYSLVDWTPAA